MTVFKTFWNIVKKYKGTVILYTVMLVVFGGLNMTTNDSNVNFVDSKPNVLIINNDSKNVITDNLVKYITDNSNIISVKNSQNAIDDALFYRDVNYIIYIPNNYGTDILEGLEPVIDVKSTGDYSASLAEMLLTKYIRIQKIYQASIDDPLELVETINNDLSKKSSVEIASTLDTNELLKASRYFNFASYSIMAVIIFIICLVMASFHDKKINKRTIVSSTNYKTLNKKLLYSSFIYSVIVWILFVLLGIYVVGDLLISIRGLIYMLNLFLFAFCSLTIALLISTIINNKNAVDGIVNVIALGSAFLCGAFVPAQFLPEFVLKIAHALPAYWYINSNDLLGTIETISIDSLNPIIINSLVLISFSVLFIIINNIASKHKRKIG